MWTSFFVDLSPEDALTELADAGWRSAELSDEHSQVLLDRGEPDATGAAFQHFADECGVCVDQGHLDLKADIAPVDDALRRTTLDSIERRLDLYAAIGIRAAVVHPGGGQHDGAAARLEQQLQSLGELTEHVAGTGIVICLENCSSGDALEPLLAATDPDRVGVCLDTGHLNLTDEDQPAFIRRCGPRLRALHLAENDGSGDQHNMPYARGGCVPWPEIAAALTEIGYAGLLNYEVPGERACPLPVRRLKLAYLKEVSGWLFGGDEA